MSETAAKPAAQQDSGLIISQGKTLMLYNQVGGINIYESSRPNLDTETSSPE
jgi:hypothetical protein